MMLKPSWWVVYFIHLHYTTILPLIQRSSAIALIAIIVVLLMPERLRMLPVCLYTVFGLMPS